MAESPNYTNTPCHDVMVLVLVALAVKKRALTLVTVPSALSFGKAIYSVIDLTDQEDSKLEALEDSCLFGEEVESKVIEDVGRVLP